ncbi:MAG: sulfur carrier protein ThiS [Bacteroidetes bacterium]|nr:sulfur carrier protein ThiS [Bacteroidota bacterium]
MKVFVNDKEQDLISEKSLGQILLKTIRDTNGIAVAVNNSVIPKKKWEQFELKENDKILIIKATQGG